MIPTVAILPDYVGKESFSDIACASGFDVTLCWPIVATLGKAAGIKAALPSKVPPAHEWPSFP
jgi:hypothetical protein